MKPKSVQAKKKGRVKMANRVKVTERAYNAVKKVASTGASKAYIMKVSGLSNMTVYRILKAKTYEEHRGKTTKISKKAYTKRKSNRSSALKLTHEKTRPDTRWPEVHICRA